MAFVNIAAPGKRAYYVELSNKSTIVGKREGNDIVVPEDGVSRRHCEIINDGSRYLVKDLSSRNGTYVDGKKISSPVPLREGSIIQLGNYRLTFSESSVGKAASVPVSHQLKTKLHARLLQEMDLKHQDFTDETEEELRKNVESTVRRMVQSVAEEIPDGVDRDALIKDVMDEALGLGPLEDLLADPEIDEIMVNAWDEIYVERHGKIEKTQKKFTSDQQVLSVIRRIIAPIGRRIDESSPMVDARLSDGSRVNAIISPLSITGPTMTIRKFAADPFSIDDLITFGTLDAFISTFLQKIVTNKANICISGGTGSGKTTLLNVLAAAIPATDRIVTIEDAAELRLPQEHVVSLESKPPNIAGEGAIRIRELVINSLRMRPDRIVVGECRGGESLDMLQAMNTGHDGSLTTLHANSPRDALGRLETMVLMAGMELPSRAIREQIASAINFIVHLARLPDGTRRVTDVVEITGMEGDTILTQKIYQFKQSGYDAEHRIVGEFVSTGMVPRFVQDLRERGVPFDLTMFNAPGKAT